MKQLFAILMAAFALTAFAAEPAAPAEKPKQEMKLAKKKDHSKDKKATPAKSPKSDKKTADKKTK